MVLETREMQFKSLLAGDRFNEQPTLSLLPPSLSGSSKAEGMTRPKNQLTIFYAGSVNVYDNISEDKANAIMLLAGNALNGNMNQLLSCLEQQLPGFTNPVNAFPEPAQKVRKQVMASPAQNSLLLSLNPQSMARPPTGNGLNIPHVASPVAPLGLPQARKASLTRFLQRRKESRAIQQTEAVKEDMIGSDFSVKNQDCSPPQEEHNSALKDGGVEA